MAARIEDEPLSVFISPMMEPVIKAAWTISDEKQDTNLNGYATVNSVKRLINLVEYEIESDKNKAQGVQIKFNLLGNRRSTEPLKADSFYFSLVVERTARGYEVYPQITFGCSQNGIMMLRKDDLLISNKLLPVSVITNLQKRCDNGDQITLHELFCPNFAIPNLAIHRIHFGKVNFIAKYDDLQEGWRDATDRIIAWSRIRAQARRNNQDHA